MRNWSIAKGHGTENDFVIMVDRHGMMNPSPADVRFLCNRRVGLGADGLLRAIKAQHMAEWDGDPEIWFMDYRNADGSVSEMCGNGLRVFARYLVDEGLAGGGLVPIATRAGLREATMLHDGRVRVGMGRVTVDDHTTEIVLNDQQFTATGADVGNPHAVCFAEDVSRLDLSVAPRFDTERYPDGTNVEFVSRVAERDLRMRVFERGVGETRSCGTGTVAAAAVAAGAMRTHEETWRVDVPGGTVEVVLEGEHAFLSGPAVIVARGEVYLPDQSEL